MSTLNLSDLLIHPVFALVTELAESRHEECYVVGGYVRDALLERPCKDIDIVTTGNGIELARQTAARLPGASTVAIFKNFGTAMFMYEDVRIEFVGARKESYRSDSRKPQVEKGTLEDDQRRRDFTINTLAVSLNQKNYGELIDPFGGLSDLNRKIIRTPLDPQVTFTDDPLRMMRAIRFASQLDFGIDPVCYKAIGTCRERIKIVSAERITDELNKIILTPRPSIGFKRLFDTGLLHIIFPQMAALHGVKYVNGKGHKDNFYHTLKVLDNISQLSDNLWLRWAAILHDIAKPLTQRFDPNTGWTFHGHEEKGARMVPAIFKQLRLPLNEKMRYVQKLVQLHLRPIVLAQETVTDSAVRRLLFEAGNDIDDLMLLCQADITSRNEEKIKQYRSNFEMVRRKLAEIEEKDRLRNWQPPIDGNLIMQTFGLKPSPQVGIIKDAIREAILDGIIPNTFEAAYELMLKKGEELGLKKIT